MSRPHPEKAQCPTSWLLSLSTHMHCNVLWRPSAAHKDGAKKAKGTKSMTNNHVDEEGQSDPDQLLTSQRTYSVERTIQDSNFQRCCNAEVRDLPAAPKPGTPTPRTPTFLLLNPKP